MANTEKKEKVGFFAGVKAEFSKITWLTKGDVARQTIAVTVISIVVGLLISVIDWLIQYGLKFITM